MEPYLERSCLALQAVGQSIQTMLGPTKMLKCYISSTPEESSILVDTVQVLDALMSSYSCTETSESNKSQSHSAQSSPPPALQFLYEACLEQKRKVGCGVTTLVCLSAYWAPEIIFLARQNIPLYFIFGIFYDALEKCKNHMRSLKLDIDTTIRPSSRSGHVSAHNSHMTSLNTMGTKRTIAHHGNQVEGVGPSKRRDRVLTYSRHFSKSSDTKKGEHNARASEEMLETKPQGEMLIGDVCMRLCGGREEAMRLAIKAWHIRSPEDGSPGVLAKLPLEYHVIGKSSSSSTVVRGVVMDLHTNMCNTAHSLQGAPCNMLVFESDCLPGHRHLGLQQDYGHVMSHDASQLYEKSRDHKWLESALSVIEKFEVKILVVGGGVSPLIWEQCIGRDVLVLKNVSVRTRAALSDMTGARPVNYFSQCSKRVVGSGVKAEVLEAGWTRPAPDVSQYKTRRSRQPIRTHCCRLYHESTSSSVATVFLCGLSEVEVDNLHHQLQNCWHRLRWASSHFPAQLIPQPCLLPGEGKTEASCIAILDNIAINEEKSNRFVEDKLPFYFSTQSVMGESSMKSIDVKQWKMSVYEAFKNGLRRLLSQIVLNSRPEMEKFQVLNEVERMVQGESGEFRAVDVGVVKIEAWSRALWLLETIFLSSYKKD